MSKKPPRRPAPGPTTLDQARNELFSHILRCGVLEAEPAHQRDWFDDTMQYLQERYASLGPDELGELRALGERFCHPVRRTEAGQPPVGSNP